MIPGSRGDFSYLVQPIPREDGLWSLAHGAGRKWKRSDCRDRLAKRWGAKDLIHTKLESRVVCGDKELLFEEAPEAYKNIDSIIEPLRDGGHLTVIARLRPLLTYKTRGACCDHE